MWNDKIEDTIRKIGESVNGYKVMHIYASGRASLFNSILIYFNIALGPLAGVLSSIDYYLEKQQLKILIMCITFLSGTIATVIKFAKLDQKSEAHKSAAAKYTSLEGNIRRQLSLYPNDRIKANEYLEWVSKSFEELFDASPLLPLDIYQRYVKYAQRNQITIPDEYTLAIDLKRIFSDRDLEGFQSTKIKTSQGQNEKKDDVPQTPVESILPDNINIVIDTEIKRGTTFSKFPELKKFCDGKMEYELKRLRRNEV